jgi:AraC-like DNA-binding protein
VTASEDNLLCEREERGEREWRAALYLSRKRHLFLGCVGQNLSSSNAAPILLLSLGDEIEVTKSSQGLVFRGRSFLIPAGKLITSMTERTDIALFYLDAVGPDLDWLAPRMKFNFSMNQETLLYREFDQEGAMIEFLKSALAGKHSKAEIFANMKLWLEPSQAFRVAMARDDRVTRAAAYVKNCYADNVSVDDIAAHVSLSVPRLIQLFKRTTGVPIRRFRVWQRIYHTILRVAAGDSLTNASVAAGFSDYAHFSRNFKEMSGVNPSDVLSVRGGVELVLAEDLNVLAAQRN